jgi:hypothetical protein
MIDVTIWCIDTAITELWEAYKLITNISRMTIQKKKQYARGPTPVPCTEQE